MPPVPRQGIVDWTVPRAGREEITVSIFGEIPLPTRGI